MNKQKITEILKKVGNAAKKLLLHNWAFKLVAAVIALVLWSALISQDSTLTRDKTFSNVQISVSGQEAAKRNGFIVTSSLADLPNVTFRVDVPQKQYAKAQASTFNIRADLSKIQQAGTQEIKLQSSNSTTYGTVTDVNPRTISIEVDNYVSRYRIPVSAIISGDPPAGFYASTPAFDPSTVTISGAKSQVERVARVELAIDLSEIAPAEGMVRTAVPFRLVDKNGNEVESSTIEVTSEGVLLDSVLVEQTVYSTKEIPLEQVGIVTGEPAYGYEVKSVSVTPQTITVAGKKSILDTIDSLFTDNVLDITGATRSVQRTLTVRKPSEAAGMSTSTIGIVVEIGDSISERKFNENRVILQGVEEGLSGRIGTAVAQVTVSGPTLAVEALKKAGITVICDATYLEPGEYDVPLQAVVITDNSELFTTSVSPDYVHVTIKEKK